VLRDRLGRGVARIEVDVRAEMATADVARHLRIRQHVAVLVREHTIFGAGDRPMVYGAVWYRLEIRIRFTLASGERRADQPGAP